jgi:hypothetical protein
MTEITVAEIVAEIMEICDGHQSGITIYRAVQEKYPDTPEALLKRALQRAVQVLEGRAEDTLAEARSLERFARGI